MAALLTLSIGRAKLKSQRLEPLAEFLQGTSSFKANVLRLQACLLALLRGPVVGRKNHYGSRSLRGTQVAAVFYTLCETARLVGVDPHAYLLRAVYAAIDQPGTIKFAEAQWAVTQASLNDVQNARNAVNSAQQSLVVAEASVASARQQVVAFQTNVDRAQIELNTAQRELKRYTELIEAGVSSRFEYDTARDRYETAKIALETAKANLEAQKIAVKEAVERANQQRIAVKEAQISIKSSEMRANQQQAMLRGQVSQREKATQLSPLNGVVADIPTRVGEFAVAGLSTTPLMTIADMSQINIEVNVDETEINNVKVGQEAKVKVDALGDKEIKAVVTQKNPLAISKSDTTGGLSNRVNVQEAKEFKVTLELRELPEDIQTALRPACPPGISWCWQ